MSALGRIVIAIAFIAGSSPVSMADDRLVRLAIPQEVADSGLMRFMLPRFTLKTQVRVEVVGEGDDADCALGAEGTPVFAGLGRVWHLEVLSEGHPGTDKFTDWITSEVGLRAITAYAPDGGGAFTPPVLEVVEEEAPVIEGDADRGKQLARAMCGRCHVAVRGESFGIGSTPSFHVLRAFDDWLDRFSVFYVLKPHPAFTQVEDVTEPFPEDRPSPIVPLELTLEDLDAILAYVSGIEPANLGAPLQVQ